MAERLSNYHSVTIDLLDRVLDKGIVIDGWWRVSLAGVDLVTAKGRVIVASIDTYLRHAPTLARTRPIPWLEREIPDWPSMVTAPVSAPSRVAAPVSAPSGVAAPVSAPKKRRGRSS